MESCLRVHLTLLHDCNVLQKSEWWVRTHTHEQFYVAVATDTGVLIANTVYCKAEARDVSHSSVPTI